MIGNNVIFYFHIHSLQKYIRHYVYYWKIIIFWLCRVPIRIRNIRKLNKERNIKMWNFCVTVSKRANPYMHRSVCNLEMVGWLVPVTRYAGLAEWLPAWNWNGDVHRNTEPYLHWNALCQSHWVSPWPIQHPTDTCISDSRDEILWFRSFVWSRCIIIFLRILLTTH